MRLTYWPSTLFSPLSVEAPSMDTAREFESSNKSPLGDLKISSALEARAPGQASFAIREKQVAR